jgi:hypothetical protein
MKQYTAQEIATILREADAVTESVADFCRRKGIAEAMLADKGLKEMLAKNGDPGSTT